MSIIEKLGINNDECLKIWEVWAIDWHNQKGDFDMVWFGYNALSEKTGVDVKRLKKFFKLLRGKSVAVHEGCINYEYVISGSGMFLQFNYEGKTWEEVQVIINER